nr:hypothetical protein BaRGS_007480 [Batillaria attramentaria]
MTRFLYLLFGTQLVLVTAELLQNGGFESLDHWDCWSPLRQESWQGPSQYISVHNGHSYSVTAYVKLLNGQSGQTLRISVNYHYTAIARTRIYFEGPDPSVEFLVDEASVVEAGHGNSWRTDTDNVINQIRKSDIHFHVTTASGIHKDGVTIHVEQKKKSFPFGMAIDTTKYNENAANGKYRDFIHKHFNWAVPGNSLKWIQVRGHCLLWSVEQYIQGWIKQLSGDELRQVVNHRVTDVMNVTRGLLPHWDVNNEILHGHWFQDRLHDPNFSLEIFRLAHRTDPNVKLFLNDYNVVAAGWSTDEYLRQARQFKAANVGLYGLGAQTHFGDEQQPDPPIIKQRLDTLAQAGLPIWITELDVMAQDENKRADFIERALRAVYGHPAVEGIVFWGFWDKTHWRGEKAAFVKGDNLQLTAAGRRLLDLLENQWMTDETRVLSQAGDQFTVRGFHGDYEVHVIYQGHEKANLKKTFTLGKSATTVNINVH